MWVNNSWNNIYIEYKRNGYKNRDLSLDEYLNNFKPYLRNIIINLQNSGTLQIQLTIAIDFISSKDSEEERGVHTSKNDIIFTFYSVVNDVTEKLFKSLRSKYQNGLETSMKGSDFIFDSVQLMYYKCHGINFKRGGSYIDSPDGIKKTKINPKNEDDKCFQYAATVALNVKEIESHPEIVSNIIQFINKYNREGINFLSKISDWETFEKKSSNNSS